MRLTSDAKRAGAVGALYDGLAPIYDLVYGLGLQHGRRRAMARLAPARGELICEVGIGTGLSARAYPIGCRAVGVDLSAAMLTRARHSLDRRGAHHVALCQMDAAQLAFRDGQFDAVYAAYVINVVPDPVRVAGELKRVCRPGGRLVFLNHFADAHRSSGLVDRCLGRAAARLGGVNWNIHLSDFLDNSALVASSIEPVNAGVSSVVVCPVR